MLSEPQSVVSALSDSLKEHPSVSDLSVDALGLCRYIGVAISEPQAAECQSRSARRSKVSYVGMGSELQNVCTGESRSMSASLRHSTFRHTLICWSALRLTSVC